MQEGDVELGGVRVPGSQEVAVFDTQVVALPDVLIDGRAVEIRAASAQLVCEVLEEWLGNQQRRLEYLGRGQDGESRRTIRRIKERMSMVTRVIQAWEGVLAVSQEDDERPVREI